MPDNCDTFEFEYDNDGYIKADSKPRNKKLFFLSLFGVLGFCYVIFSAFSK